MIKAWFAFWTTVVLGFGGLLFWRNRNRYHRKSVVWLIAKSFIELVLLMASAAYLPAALIGWLILWVTRPIKSTTGKMVVGTFAGVLFGVLSSFALEVLVILGIFAIDQKSGSAGGIMGRWEQTAREARERRHLPAIAA